MQSIVACSSVAPINMGSGDLIRYATFPTVSLSHVSSTLFGPLPPFVLGRYSLSIAALMCCLLAAVGPLSLYMSFGFDLVWTMLITSPPFCCAVSHLTQASIAPQLHQFHHLTLPTLSPLRLSHQSSLSVFALLHCLTYGGNVSILSYLLCF